MRIIRFLNCHDAKMYNKGYEDGKADGLATVSEERADERAKILEAMIDIVDCDTCPLGCKDSPACEQRLGEYVDRYFN